MEKINNVQQLQTARKQLKQRRRELEKAIHYDWHDLKDSLMPINLAKQLFAKIFEKKIKNDTAKNSLADIGAVVRSFANKVSEEMKEKVEKWIKH